MLMVIFGAGASYDSCPTYPPGTDVPTSNGLDRLNHHYRPPLANELFANRPHFADTIERYPDCQPIIPRLRSLAGETLEVVLEDLQTKAEAYARGRRQMAAVRCYLGEVISTCDSLWSRVSKGITNYKSLLDQIERTHPKEQVCLVTFNYDTLLEDALRHFGLPITNFDDYTRRHPFFRIFKLHGSTNWAREIETNARIEVGDDPYKVFAQLMEHWDEIHITDRYLFGFGGSLGVGLGKPTFPAIAIPVEKKRSFECPQHMIDELTALLPQVTKILVIGWRATENHFLELLQRHLSWGRALPAYIVAGNQNQAEEVKGLIHHAVPGLLSSAEVSVGFTAFMLSGRAQAILSI